MDIGKEYEMLVYTRKDEGIKFVVKAIYKGVDRGALQYVHVTEGYIEATDGNRLHRITNDNMKPGLYEIVKNTKKEVILVETEVDTIYPNTDKVWPDVTDMKCLNIQQETYVDLAYTEIIRAVDEDFTLQFSYFKDIFTLGTHWKVYHDNRYRSVRMESEDRKALIMPLRCK